MSIQQPTPADKLDRAARAAAVGLWLALAAVVVAKNLHDPENHSTFPIFRGAALAWFSGENVYDSLYFGSDYRYGPAFAMAICPLAWLPYRAGAALWGLLNVGIAWWATVGLCRRVLPGMTSPRLRSFVLIAALPPAAHCLYTGQTNLLVFSLAAFAAIALVEERWWLAALLLSAAVHIKVWPLAGALLLTACWPRRLWWRLPLALLAVAALPLLVKPPHVVLDQYVQWYQHVAGQSPNRHPGYRDGWTMWEAVVGPVNRPVYTIVQLAAAALALGLCLLRRAREAKPFVKGALRTAVGAVRDHHTVVGRLRATHLFPEWPVLHAPYAEKCRLALFVLVAWTTWQLAFGPGTERNTFGLIAPLTGWAVVAAIAQRRAAWFMAVSYLLTVVASIRGVEELNPWLKTLHPLGILLFFGWFLWWNAGERPLFLQVGWADGHHACMVGESHHRWGILGGTRFTRPTLPQNQTGAADAPSCVPAETC